MIKLEVIDYDKQHFLLSANEPMRVEVLPVHGRIIAHVYRGTEIDMEQEPIGAFDGTLGDDGGHDSWEDPEEEPKTHRASWAGWAEAFHIFAKYGEGCWSTQAEHDQVWAGPDADLVSENDQRRLRELGWKPAEEGGWTKNT